tara:strand:- start:290 stop:535 length:246 start_codon:yes stop_codon:yes gene_type:complete
MSRLAEKIVTAEAALTRLKDASEDTFTTEQLAALTEVMDAWNSVKGFITVMRYTGITLKWCVGFALAWAAFKSGLLGSLID